MRKRFCAVEAANYLLSQHRHIETEEFKRRVAVDPAVQCLRLEDDYVVRRVCNFTDLFTALAVQGHLAGAGDYVENILLRAVVNGNRAFGVDMPAHYLDACARQFIK